MFQSFFVYIIFGLFLFILGNISALRQKNNNLIKESDSFWTFDIVLALLIFAFVSGLRWNVGVDHLHYLSNYLSIQKNDLKIIDFEFGFNFITQLFAKNKLHFSFYFGFIAFLQLFFIYRTFKNQRYLFPFLGIVIIFGSEYLNWMNGMRQMLVATILVWSIQFIQKKQLLKYLIIIILCFTIHKSAIFLFILYFIPVKDYFKNRIFTYCLVIFSILFNTIEFFLTQISSEGTISLLEITGYDWISSNFVMLSEEKHIRIFGPRRIVITLLIMLTIWYSTELKKTFKNSFFITYYNFTILGFVLYNVLSEMNHIFIRPIAYLTIFSVFTTAYLLVYLKKVKRLMFFIALILSLLYLPISIIADYSKGKDDNTNYKFYWYNHTE